MSEVAEFYDQYTDRQKDSGINRRHKSIDDWLTKFGMTESDSVLEIGCGIGTMTQLLASRLSKGSILANDISQKSVEMAQRELSHFDNLQFVVGDIVKLELKDKFDLILLPDVLEHIPIADHPKLFLKLSELLKDEGMIVIHIPDPYFLAWRHTDANQRKGLQIIDQSIYTNELVNSIYPAGLHIEHLQSYSVHVENNDYQIIKLKKTHQRKYPRLKRKTSLMGRVAYKLKRIFS